MSFNLPSKHRCELSYYVDYPKIQFWQPVLSKKEMLLRNIRKSLTCINSIQTHQASDPEASSIQKLLQFFLFYHVEP
jgi:hypothetical protein